MKARNKPRLYLTLYARPKYPKTYHYALQISPKHDAGYPLSSNAPPSLIANKYHCTNTIQRNEHGISFPWIYESSSISPLEDSRLLARILLGKLLVPIAQFDEAMKCVPIPQNCHDPAFSCVKWVKLAVESLMVGTPGMVARTPSYKSWDCTQKIALEFVNNEKRSGRFETDWKDSDQARVATLFSWK
jgi:hypothetical protein